MEKDKELYKGLVPFLNCKDYTVSGTVFSLFTNSKYNMLVTYPVPRSLQDYYKSVDYISHTDSKKTVVDKLYRIVKVYSLGRKLLLLNSFNMKKKTILDLGAGTGDFLSICKRDDWKVVGVEPSSIARKVARKKGINLYEDLNEIVNQKFDVITLWHVLEHVQNLQGTIKTLKYLLNPGGRIVVAVPNHKSADALFYKEHWAAFDVPRHLWHFSQFSIHSFFSEVEMNIERVLPMKFDSYYVSLLSEKYKNGKSNFVMAFYRGLISNIKARKSSEYSSLIYVIKN
jgi:2-polyprenyl-3-methyl-5-hydroxy-6-metoxy-1,4-benzoquinol methylase